MPDLLLEDVTLRYDQSGEGPDIVWIAGGDQPGSDWHLFQTPAFDDAFRSTTFDARGAGATESREPPPWPISLLAADCAALIEAVCRPPVFLVGLSMGSLMVQELALERPDLVRCAVAMGTASHASGYQSDWMRAEVEFRRAGGELPRPFATTHYGVYMYPPDVLGDEALWEKLRPLVERDYGSRDGEFLAAQWQACIDFDSRDRLAGCRVPLHVIAFSHDVQTPPPLGAQVAAAVPDGELHLLEGLGHCSCFGHRPDVVNEEIRAIIERYA